MNHLTGGLRVAGRSSRRGRRVLVTAQVALAVIVVAATGLLVRSVLRLEDTGRDLGAEHLVLVSLALPQDRYADRDRHLRFLEDLVARLEASPAVDAATPINAVPFSGTGWDAPAFTAEGQEAAQVLTNGSLDLEAIEPGYFETFGVPLVKGRGFHPDDRRDSTPVAIVSEDVAARLWPGQDAIGKRLKMGGVSSPDVWRTVVGIAASTRYRDLRAARATLYVPARQLIVSAQSLVVRSAAALPLVTTVVQEQVKATDADVRVSRVAPFAELLLEPLARPRFYAILLALFGGASLLLAAVGLYAVMAASVRQRHTEIGVRLALGAAPADVRRLIVREGVLLAGIGSGLGLVLAVLLTRFLGSLLYGVRPLDLGSLGGAALLLLAVALVAAYIPARAAARMEPVSALHAD